MKKIIIGAVLVAIAVVFWKWPRTTVDSLAPAPVEVQGTTVSFSRQKKSAHFETSTPAHGALLAGVPTNVVIDFNFDLGPGSKISVVRDGVEYATGETMLDRNLLAMRRGLDPATPDGLYAVVYSACWPDGSCHDGRFEFVVDRSSSGAYEDMTGKKTLTIELEHSLFTPHNIKISLGTTITWINKDDVVHYINTDSHPAHTYYPTQNSKALKKGEQYVFTFDQPGVYPYHCSAHAETMTGNILVI